MKYLPVLLLILILLAADWLGYQTAGNLQIFFLDIGQGNAILAKTPDNKLLLIDGGPDASVIARLSEVLPYWQRKIDLVIATHPDADHISGLLEVARRYEVEGILYNVVQPETMLAKKLLEFWKLQKIKLAAIDSGSDFTFGCCVFLDFVWPQPGTELNQADTNSTSIALILHYGNFSAFFGGDLPKNLELQAVAGITSGITILQVSHHGSKNSSGEQFLLQVKPQLAIISCGKNNRYGHPHKQVLDLFAKLHIPYLRTDRNGGVTINTDGRRFSASYT